MMRTFVTFLLVLGICRASFPFENINDDEVKLKNILPSGIVKPIAYKLHLKPDLVKFTFDGETEITLIALITDVALTLNSKFLTVHDLKFVDLNTTKTLEITLYKILISILKNYYLSPCKLCKIQFFFHSSWFVSTTHFEPTFARLAFPCWDEPAYKAKFNISLTHNKTFQAISNTDVLKKEEKDGMMITTFKETPLMSTYLVAFVICDYRFKEDKVGNFTYRVWTKESAINYTDYALKMGRKILEFMNLYTNISYQTYMPDKLDQVTIRNFYPGGAMENWGLLIYSETALLYDEASSPINTKFYVLRLVAHEFSHQWFGNLVSPKWWKYLWLNDGFTNYFVYFIAHKRYVAYLTKALTTNVGYEPKANDSDLVKMFRIDAMKWACEAGVKDCTSYAEKIYQEWLKNPQIKLDVNLKTEILCAGVRNANQSTWTHTLEYIIASMPDDDTLDQMPALACSNSSKILTEYLNSTLNPRLIPEPL
ncbi:aminopeptidase N-like, partial [Ceratina calcarata]|uniref:Aminopeptidase N-like n=1 Tax=Ceratina calcarata TaxID=156304 RepID=A0AAJ7WDA5_9HYME